MNFSLKNRLFPEPLHPGDTVGIAAPASPVNEEDITEGINILKSMGFKVFIPDEVIARKGYLAGSDYQRADTLNKLFLDNNIKAILSARGGFGSIRILRLLNYYAIRNHPKIISGFSDITALLTTFYKRCSGPQPANDRRPCQRSPTPAMATLDNWTRIPYPHRCSPAIDPRAGRKSFPTVLEKGV